MDDVPRPRLCHMRKWSHFDGYGFNLHAEKNKPGQFIGAIDAESPAEAVGLIQGDRIVEVNGVNVGQENHKQVVQRIKAIPGEAKLLVVDKVCEEFHREKDIVVTGTLPYVLHLFSEKTEVLEEDQNDDVELLPNESIEEIPDAHSAPTFSEEEIETESLSEKETENDNQIQVRAKTQFIS